MLRGQSKGEADGHPLRNVVQGHGKDKKCGPLQTARDSLRLFGIWMEVGKQAVQHEEKQGAQQKTARSGQVSGDPGRLCLFDRGDEQGPDRGSNHNARRKPQEQLLRRGRAASPKEKDQCRPK